MSYGLPPIVRLAEQLLVDVENAVARFPRTHRFATGADLRREAKATCVIAHRAWRDRANQAAHVADLVRAVDELKVTLQIGKLLAAFTSFGQFEALIRIAVDLGRQVGGWHKSLSTQGQNGRAAPVRARGQRPTTLSDRAASAGANA